MPKRHGKNKKAFSIGRLKSLFQFKHDDFIDEMKSWWHWDLALLAAALLFGILIPQIPRHYRANGVFLVQDSELRPVIFDEVYGELQRLVSDKTLMPVAAKALQPGRDDLWAVIHHIRDKIFIRSNDGDNVGLVQVDFDAPKQMDAVQTLNAILQSFSAPDPARKAASTAVSVVVWPTLDNVQIDQRARLAVASLAVACLMAFFGRRWFGARRGAFGSAKEAEKQLGMSEIARLLPAVRRDKESENDKSGVALAQFLAGSMPLVAEGAPVIAVAACELAQKKSLALDTAHNLATDHDKDVLLLDMTAKETPLFAMQPISQAVQPGDVEGVWIGGAAVSAHLLVACSSEKGRQWIDRLRSRFDAIVIVAPDDMRLAGVPGLLAAIDGVVLAVKGGVTMAESARRLVRDYQAHDARLLGVSFTLPPELLRHRLWRNASRRCQKLLTRISRSQKPGGRRPRARGAGARLFS